MFRVELAIVATCFAAPLSAQAVPAFEPVSGEPVCRGTAGYSAEAEGARTYLWRPRWIAAIRNDAALRAEVLEAGEAALDNGPYSVTDKPRALSGAAANDYASIGPYWWPSKSGDGLPYTRRDGEVNPERDGPEFDRSRIRDLANDMRNLSLSYHLSGDERFSKHAAILAHVWFVAPKTRMNPHFRFAQGIPGKVEGRGEGIIEASDLSTIVESLGLLWNSDALSAHDKRSIRQWYADFSVWMATSNLGADEMRKTNNHGVFFDFYLAHFLLFAGAEDLVKAIVNKFPEYRLGVQMDSQGRFIEELKRTRSWHYSHFVVDGAARLATVGECVGLDLWDAQLADGRSLATAKAFLDRYAANPASWPFPDRDHAAGKLARMTESSRRLNLLFDTGMQPAAPSDLP